MDDPLEHRLKQALARTDPPDGFAGRVMARRKCVMSERPTMTGACCPKSDDSVIQLRLGEGHTVGIMGLGAVFEQLWVSGRKPEETTGEELVGMVRAQKNYIPSKASVEATYATALRREYAAFYVRR